MKYNPTYDNIKEYNPIEIEQEMPRFEIQRQPTETYTVQGYKPQFNPTYVAEDKPTFSNTNSPDVMRKESSKYLQKALGLTPEQAAGLIGVWQAESGFNLKAENTAEKKGKNSAVKSSQYGIGIGQWTGKRHDDYVNFINSKGGEQSLQNQLDFAIQEIKTKYPEYLQNLKSAKSVEDATALTYVQYVGGNATGIKDSNDLYRRVKRLEDKYAAKHIQMYGKAGSGNFERRLKFARENVFMKNGGVLRRV